MRKIIIIFLVGCLFFCSGCSNERGETKETPMPEITQSVVDINEVAIQLYTIDESTIQSVSETVFIPKEDEITAQRIVQEVITLFSVHAIEIKVDNVVQKDNILYVSFKENFAPITGVSPEVEEVILESISKSLVDNLLDVEKIIFQKESKAYQSDNLILEEDEVYWWK